ncbi:unnamed protein product [Vitrella brassicaformis CCMP3155]|uniref:Uncharacterized protein n=1 Tax=Vitrella brassicaformis (strain CCMP3155) TaxID=1169540 RepID=A0A0G4EG41_VITBC|nr:unnamed protein product [Vitrella brassicaformis CCMP3155]|eukprot:CEL94411.1 unnamed protein product [Vitrella brassicaformis CCMP3155]
MVLLTAEGSLRGALHRLTTTWPFFAPTMIIHVGGAVFFHVEALWPYRIIIAGCFYVYVGLVQPVMVFRQVALTSRTVVRKRLYVMQMGLVFLLIVTYASSTRSCFLPLAQDAASGGENKSIVVITWLVAMSPLVALLMALVRSLRDGPALQTGLAISYPAVAFVLYPRIVQAEMQHPSSQVLTSLIFASFDLLTDMAIPYLMLVSGAAKRALVRCLSSWKARRKVRHQHSNDTSHTIAAEDTAENAEETITDKQLPAKLLSRLSTTVLSFYTGSRTGASALFSRQSLRSLSSFLDVPTRVVQFKLHPIFLRRLSDQMHAYGLAELTVLILTNASFITLDQVVSPSLPQLLERVAGLLIMVLIEVVFEGVLFVWLVRSANLPLLRSMAEPGFMRMYVLGLAIGGGIIVLRGGPYFVLWHLSTLDESRYGQMGTQEFCPYHSTLQDLP